MFVSFNDGDAWQPLQLDLPPASVRDLVVRNDALVIATHGRSFWILDDVTPLRQWDARVASAAAWLFAPQVAYRVRQASDEGTPFPPETPAGENPPAGAIIDYTIGPHAAHNATLEILDGRGAPVRRWSTADSSAPLDPRKIDIPASWVRPPMRLSAAPGLHRFVWDLRYAASVPPSREEAGDPFFVPGLWAVPGMYTVRLTLDGRTLERPLQLALDPREGATAGDLAAQFAFSRDVEALRAEVLRAGRRQPQNPHFADIDAALARVEAAAQSAPAAPTSDARTALEQQRAAFASAGGGAPQQ